jgi:hypothetical protein
MARGGQALWPRHDPRSRPDLEVVSTPRLVGQLVAEVPRWRWTGTLDMEMDHAHVVELRCVSDHCLEQDRWRRCSTVYEDLLPRGDTGYCLMRIDDSHTRSLGTPPLSCGWMTRSA